MEVSSELQRFLADHSSEEPLSRLVASAGPVPDAKSLAAAARAHGYDVTEAEVTAAMRDAETTARELGDEELDLVTGGVHPLRGFLEALHRGAREGRSPEAVAKEW